MADKQVNMDNKVKVEYQKPIVERIDLALEETLSAGCKVGGTVCDDPFDPLFAAGS
jgi:hypothetical protein